MDLYQKIIIESRKVNEFWESKNDDDFEFVKINFGKYTLTIEKKFDYKSFPPDSFFIVDKNLHLDLDHKVFMELEASESKTKNIDFINSLVTKYSESFKGRVLVAVGGGSCFRYGTLYWKDFKFKSYICSNYHIVYV